ncbi:hypothetical protein BDP27DRAFT_1419341 [Rhodocollybia butyracea]|uniref:Uncharacterized protein n=1 Tax=Rhodocollybia butyracea TaxID=206335 RepID=A0A9P5PXH5_9AGAR|nr:hypothetical protein BDP27DRAFT_1419341 [Rhodocollybia butyracea]
MKSLLSRLINSQIPLGSLFTFGGSTSPVSTSTTATPTTSSISATPSSSSSLTSTSLTSFTSASTSLSLSSQSASSATPSATGPVTQSQKGLERGQLIAVIIASILGFIFLFVLALFLYLWWNARRNRRRANGNTRFMTVAPADEDEYYIVPPGGVSPGEGSPRVSGEEADPFLQRQSEMQQTAGPSTTMRQPTSVDNSVSSSGKTSSNSASSGYGTLLQNPSLGVFVPQFDERRGNILSPEELRQFDDVPRPRLSTVGEQGELVPLTTPPRLVDAPRSQAHTHTGLSPKPSLISQASDAGEVTLLTARRVRAEDLGPRPVPLSPGAESSRRRESGAWRGLGLAGLAALGRSSWFQNITGSSSSRRNSQAIAPIHTTGLTDNDVEAGRALLGSGLGSPLDMSEAPSPRFRGQLGLGVGYGGDRPVSGVSANSRTSTIYHDAHSSLPGTPQILPPPRALANSSSAELGYWPPLGAETASGTIAAQGRSQQGRTGTQSTSTSTASPTAADVLDMPAPRGISPFVSSKSLREGTTSSQGSDGKAEFPYPPGLTSFSTPGVWNETNGTTPSPGSFAATVLLPSSGDSGIGIDVLEEEPPSPGDSWRSLAGGPSGPRRTTFGLPQFVNAPTYNSEQGSLHSMRSHLSPRSTGSASASRREQSGSSGSASSRPSARSTGARSIFSSTDASGSLAHSGSISSDERRKHRFQPSLSPALSAFGHVGSTSGHSLQPSYPGSPFIAEDADKDISVTIPTSIPEAPTVGDSSGDRSQTSPRSPRIPLSAVPWAGGLDDAWSPS